MEKKEKTIGTITHFFDHISVAIIKLTGGLGIGDEIKIKGATTDFNQKIESIQYEHKDLMKAKAGQEVGIKVNDKVREGDKVFKS